MIRVLILASLGAVISAFSIYPDVADYSHSLAHLIKLNKRNDVATKKERTLCETDECKFIAKELKNSIDDTVDPCDDFYDYACGNWAKNNPIPKGETHWNWWKIVKTKINDQIKGLIKKKTKPDDIFAVKMAKNWYKSCMDTDRIGKTGLESLLNTLWRHGGWPLIMDDGEWDDRAYTWQKLDDHYARLMGYNAFHDVVVTAYMESDEFHRLIFLTTPNVPHNTYRVLMSSKPTTNDDSSDENDESGEISHETGSKEINVSTEEKGKKGTESDEENTDEDDKDGQGESREKMLTKKKLKTKIIHGKKEKSDGSKASKKQSHGKNTMKRIKRRTMEFNDHNNKRIKNKRSHEYDSVKRRVTILKHKQKAVDSDTEESTESSKADDENEDENDDTNEDNDENGDGNEDETDEEKEESLKKFEEQYTNVVKSVALTLAEIRGVKVSDERLDQAVRKLWKFQMKLAMISEESDGDNVTLNSFQEEYDTFEPKTSNAKVNWVSKVGHLFTQAGVEIDENFEVYPYSDYFRDLCSLLDETSSETLVNYVHWNFIVHILKAASIDFINKEYDEDDEKTKYNLRAKDCIQEVEITRVLGYEYARDYFPDNVAQAATDMVDDIQKAVEHQIKESTWMDDDTRHSILDKLVHMKSLIGYPDWYRNETIVKRYFQGLTVGPSYYENVLNYMRFRKWKDLRRITEVDGNNWNDLNPLMLNAFFSPDDNSIAISAADFQAPLFALNRPWYVNFAIIGMMMAHEVNHGFDNNGRHYDQKGNPVDWIPAMAKAYDKRAECFVDQYNNYKFGSAKNITIENYGNHTTGENIADTMGLHAVFQAYRRRERQCQKPDLALPGLEDFSNDQLFFLSVGNMWCQNMDEQQFMDRLKYDPHSTPRLRVIGPLSNSEDFAKAYKCPVGSPMNPEKKCNIWK